MILGGLNPTPPPHSAEPFVAKKLCTASGDKPSRADRRALGAATELLAWRTWRFMGSYKGSFKGPFKGIYRDSIRV